MRIKRTVSTFIQNQYSGKEEHSIRVSVRWNRVGHSKKEFVAFNVGHSIHPKKWSPVAARVKRNSTNEKMIPAFEINKQIQFLEEVIDRVFKKFEVEEQIPNKKDLRDSVNIILGKSPGKKTEMMLLQSAFSTYILDLSNRRTFSEATFAKLRTVRNIFKQYDAELTLNEITSDKLDDYVNFLINERKLQNTTIKKNLSFVRTFLSYCEDRKLMSTDWKTHELELKVVSGQNIVFLEKNEFEILYNLEFPENKKYLERARDVFCFQCLTSLRYSDVAKLKKNDIDDQYLYSVTEKTDKTLQIPLSIKANELLSKYKDLEGELALPVQSNQKMNEYIKEVCYIAGLDQPITQTYFKGKERISETFKKYELIGTHTARRTFICIALADGVTPETVMKITGHSNYKSMQPYIDVTDSAKKRAVNIFN